MQEQIFNELWKRYTAQNPSAQAIHDLFTKEGENVINDHVAFRTFDDPRMNIQVLSKKFLKAGYEFKGEYVFEDKHLKAVHLEHPSEKNAPRVFISELIQSKFSEEFQKLIKKRINSVGNAYYGDPDLIFNLKMKLDSLILYLKKSFVHFEQIKIPLQKLLQGEY